MPDPTLLVIEDAREHAILVRVAARRALPGLDVRVAGDGREGIAYLAGTPPFQDQIQAQEGFWVKVLQNGKANGATHYLLMPQSE